MSKLVGMWFVVGILSVSTCSLAQEPLPKTLEGGWRAVFGSKRVQVNGPMTVTIEKQGPDGSIVGRFTYLDNRNCEATEDPITGKFDGQTLTLQVMFRDKIPNAGCGRSRFVLTKNPDGSFEGEIPGSSTEVKVKLAPK